MRSTEKRKTTKEVLEYMKKLILLNKWSEVRKLRPRLKQYMKATTEDTQTDKSQQSLIKTVSDTFQNI